jgi:hypothetical protein
MHLFLYQYICGFSVKPHVSLDDAASCRQHTRTTDLFHSIIVVPDYLGRILEQISKHQVILVTADDSVCDVPCRDTDGGGQVYFSPLFIHFLKQDVASPYSEEQRQ